MMTVGDKIDEMAKQYIGLYERFRADERWRDKASGLATYDLMMREYVANQMGIPLT